MLVTIDTAAQKTAPRVKHVGGMNMFVVPKKGSTHWIQNSFSGWS